MDNITINGFAIAYLVASLFILLSTFILWLKNRKGNKAIAIYYLFVVYLTFILLLNLGFILFTAEVAFPIFVIITTLPLLIYIIAKQILKSC